jgi:hypothetical protein
MTLMVILILLAVTFVVGYMVRQASELPKQPHDIDPEQAMKAAIELHRIRRNLDVAWTKTEQKREGAAMRREIADALKDDGE